MLKARQYIGKYRIEKRLALGGFAAVYRAFDTIEGIRIALKIPHDEHVTEDALRTFRNEARLAAKLDHPNVLPIKDASIIEDRFAIASPLGETTLLERWQKRMTMQKRLELVEQMLADADLMKQMLVADGAKAPRRIHRTDSTGDATETPRHRT